MEQLNSLRLIDTGIKVIPLTNGIIDITNKKVADVLLSNEELDRLSKLSDLETQREYRKLMNTFGAKVTTILQENIDFVDDNDEFIYYYELNDNNSIKQVYPPFSITGKKILEIIFSNKNIRYLNSLQKQQRDEIFNYLMDTQGIQY